jgi:micrococcal nuclease
LVVAMFLAGCASTPDVASPPPSLTPAPSASTVPPAVPTTPHFDSNAKVVGITDGDTIKAVIDGVEERVRLDGIDTPERNQPFGTTSKQALSDHIFGDEVHIENLGRDRYKRILGRITTKSGLDVSREMVRLGMAWHYVKYSKDPDLADAELQARKNRRGLWSDPAPVAPWDWRKN